MVDKKIKFDILIGGIPQIKNSLLGITASARNMEMNIRQMSERTAQRVVELNRAKEASLKKLGESGLKDANEIAKRKAKIEENSANAILNVQERHANATKHLGEKVFLSESQLKKREEKREEASLQRILAAKEKAANKAIHLAEKVANKEEALARKAAKVAEKAAKDAEKANQPVQINWMQVASHASGSVGAYKTGHLIRMANQLGIGSDIGAEAGAGAAAEGAGGAAGMSAGALAGLGAVAGIVAVGLGAVYIASKALEVGFEVASAQAKYLASSFLGAAAQIGGAKNLQEILVNASEKQTLTKATRFTVGAEERLSEDELQARATAISIRADLGAPSSEDVLQSQKRIGVLTGRQRSIPQSQLEFIAKMSHIGNTPMPEMANTYGQVVAQNKNASPQEIEQLFRSAIAIGQKGAFSVSDIPEARKLIQVGGQLGGSGIENTKNSLAIGTILRPRAGTLEEAGTQYQAFVKAAQVSNRQGNLPTDMKKYFNKSGQITNINELIANTVATPYMERPKAFGSRVESTNFLSNISRQAGITDTDSKDQQKQKVLDLLNEFQSATMSIEEFNRANEESISIHDKLTASFNLITDELGAAFLPILEQLVPDIESFAKILTDNKDKLSTAILHILDSLVQIFPASLQVAKALTYLADFFAMTVRVMAAFLKNSPLNFLFAKELESVTKAGIAFNEAQDKIRPILDDLIKGAEEFKHIVESTKATEATRNSLIGAPNVSIHEIEIQGSRNIVNAIKGLHRDVVNGPNGNREPTW